MATRKISWELRRLSRSYHSLRPLQSCVHSNPNFPPAPTRPDCPTTSNLRPNNQLSMLIPFSTSFRYFSSGPSEPEFSSSGHSLSSVTESELESILTDASGIPVPDLGDVIGGCDYILPIRAIISMLDWIHDSTGLPWWITIVSSTLMLRVSLFPIRVFQLHKLKRIGECAPKLPPPFPPPFSGKSYAKHFSNFRRERKAIGCPSYLWSLAYISVQGSLVYWVSNSSLNVIQHLCLQNSTIQEKLGLSREQAVVSAKDPEPESFPGSKTSEALDTSRKVPVKDLSPKELLSLSVLSLTREDEDKALFFLRLALDKDPEYVRALTIMGQTLLQKRQEVEAVKYFERAIAKLSRTGLPTEVEDVDLLIQASQWAGVGYIRQGKLIEGRVHLERVASLEEPEDVKSKAHYYDGIVLLASTLLNEGRKAEAIAYLQKAAAYNSHYNEYLEQCKKE